MKKIYVAISSIALLFIIGCGGGGNNDNVGGGNETGSVTDDGNETSGSWLDFFPPFEGPDLRGNDYEKTINISTEESTSFSNGLRDKGFTGPAEYLTKAEDGVYQARATFSKILDSGSEDGIITAYKVNLAISDLAGKKLGENDMLEMFGGVTGEVIAYNMQERYNTDFDYTAYSNTLANAEFNCGQGKDYAYCEKCDENADMYYAWNGFKNSQGFGMTKGCK